MSFLFVFVWSAGVEAYRHHINCPTVLQELPLISQSADNTCGIACIRSILKLGGVADPGEAALVLEAGVYINGYTTVPAILKALRDRGFTASSEVLRSVDDIYDYLQNGESVIVSFFDGEVGHYSAVSAVNARNIVLMDP